MSEISFHLIKQFLLFNFLPDLKTVKAIVEVKLHISKCNSVLIPRRQKCQYSPQAVFSFFMLNGEITIHTKTFGLFLFKPLLYMLQSIICCPKN